eukprot:12294429-Ditylum_brightwellii.AAC.1
MSACSLKGKREKEREKERDVFPLPHNLNGGSIDLDNLSRETENKYAIKKFNYKKLEELCDDTPEYESTFNTTFHN